MTVATKAKEEGLVMQLPSGNLPTAVEVKPPLGVVPAQPIIYPKKLVRAFVNISKEIGVIEKEGYHEFHHYYFQRWEDIRDRISPLIPENGLFIQQSQIASTLFENDVMMAVQYQFTIVHEDGEAWPDRPVWMGVARLKDQKGVYDDKCANKCAAQAHKYFFLHMFNIATRDAVDDDSDGSGRRTKAPDPKAKPGDPREVTIARGGAQDWIDAFMAATEAADSVEKVEAFERLNDFWLKKVFNAKPELYADVRTQLDRHKAALAEAQQAKEVVQDAGPSGPPNNTQPASVSPSPARAPAPPPRRPQGAPTEAEINRSQSAIEAILGPDDPAVQEATFGVGEQTPQSPKNQLIADIRARKTSADIDRFYRDPDVLALLQKCPRQDIPEVKLALEQRRKELEGR